MMLSLGLVPLVVALAAAGFVALAQVSPPATRLARRVALRLLGDVPQRGDSTAVVDTVATTRTRRLRAAHSDVTYRKYAATTLLYATVVGVAGSVVATYLVVVGLAALGVPPDQVQGTLPAWAVSLTTLLPFTLPPSVELFVLLFVTSATLGLAAALGTVRARWWWPRYVADERGRRIDESTERTVAFLYALSRSGMSFQQVMAILSENRDVFGEAATEFGVTVREIDVLGIDLLDAVERMGVRTPSDDFRSFSENLVNVLRSGQSLPAFFGDQHEYFKEESETRQAQFVELLATLAEGYVTVLVAGPLFLITILMIFGLVLGGTLDFLRLLVYALIPLSAVGFAVYLDSVSVSPSLDDGAGHETFDAAFGDAVGVRSTRDETVPEQERADGGSSVSGGGPTALRGIPAAIPDRVRRANEYRRAVYDRLRPLRPWLRAPVRQLVGHPTRTLYFVAPAALALLAARLYGAWETGALDVALLDDLLIQSSLLVLGAFALVYEVHARRVRAVERAVPDFLDRLASINEAGIPIVESFEQVVGGDVGALNQELARTWTDIQWGARVETALWRFERRLATPMTTRAVTLVTNAMNASGQIGPVLRIAADDAKATRRLRRERRQELLTYTVVIYLAFFVFVTIIATINLFFIPAIPTVEELGSTTAVGSLSGLDPTQKTAYQTVLFHAGVLQGLTSGFIAGQMGEGSLKAGAKHAFVMVLVAYGTLLVFGG
jgi:flagellar protein FlaJ